MPYADRSHPASGYHPLIPILTLLCLIIGISPLARADFQCFYPTADAFAWNFFGSNQDQNYGTATTLEVAQLGDVTLDQRYTHLRFNLDTIPPNATVQEADLELYLRDIREGTESQTFTRVRAITENWSETTLTWNNRPSLGGTVYDEQTISEASNTPGWRSWQIDSLVNGWVNNNLINHGVALISSGLGSPAAIFDSREAASTRGPRLCVQWTTGAVFADLQVDDIEVTQGIQDLNNSVRLVAGKRTYVRVHVSGSGGRFRTFATLNVSNGTDNVTLEPINPGAGHIVSETTPNREVLNDAFLFRLPNAFTQGSINLTATVNPVQSWRPRYPSETTYANNSQTTSVSFETVPTIGIIGYLADYSFDDGSNNTVEISTPSLEFRQMIDWIQRAFPVSQVWYTVRRLDLEEVTMDTSSGSRVFSDPVASDVNASLTNIRQIDLNEDTWYDDRVGDERDIRYYGMVLSNGGGFMRGRGGIPGAASSGPTGDDRFNWDTDGSYGDWYGAHEVAHNFDRRHAVAGCGSEGAGGYPYTDGRISPFLTGDQAIFGFDIGTRFANRNSTREQDIAIYDPNWRDVMTYCDNQWLGDFTYEGLMDYFQANVTALSSTRLPASPRGALVVVDRLSIVGNIDPNTNEVSLEPIFLVPNAVTPELRVPGDYDIVLEGSGGVELARYPFTPERMESGRPAGGPATPEVSTLFIAEMVAHVNGTQAVVIEGPQGELARVSAGPGQPSVNLLSPAGGGVITADPVPVSWSASDPDNDALSFNVQFSDDGGVSWETVATALTSTSTTIPRDNLPTTEEGLFRVWASDGINTTTDTSSAPFELSARPLELQVLAPAEGIVVSAGQTLTLEVDAFSPNYGALPSNQVAWVSSIDGFLGNGEELAVTGLSPGLHDFTVLANDGTLSLPASAQVTDITVVEHAGRLPPPRNELAFGPTTLAFRPEFGETTHTLSIDNLSGEAEISWTAGTLASWIELGSTSGTTPAEIQVSVDTSGLEPGTYRSGILLASSDTSGLQGIPVTLWLYERALPPLIFRDGFETEN